MDTMLSNQQKLAFISSKQTLDTVLRTYQEQWLLEIDDENESRESKLLAPWCSHHHHHVVLLAWISLTLSRHFSLSFIASDRSSGLHPVSSHSCCMYVLAGHPAFAQPYVGVHRSTSLMSLSRLCFSSSVLHVWFV